jgi:signal transduction histidine kinase
VDEACPTAGELRADAVLRVLQGGALSDVARELAVAPALLQRWCETFLTAGVDALTRARPHDDARSLLLAVLAHELRRPLTTLQGMALLLVDPRTTPDQRARIAAAVRGQVDRVDRLTRDLGDETAMAAGTLQLRIEPTPVPTVVDRVVAGLEADTVRVGSVADVVVPLDGDRITQVLDNLVANAREHGGATVELRATVEGPWLRFEVSDDGGTPLPLAVVRRLFEPFERGGASSGSGLGLYIVRTLVVAHGGQVGADADDERTTFWVQLPLAGPANHHPNDLRSRSTR